MTSSLFQSRVRAGRIGAALALAFGTLSVASIALDFGQTQTAAGATGCGMSLANPVVQGAAGSFIFVVDAVPAVPGQGCNATISITGTIATSGGARPTNVTGNGLTHNVTVSFLPGQPPPQITWRWSPHCADPAQPAYNFTASSSSAGTVSTPIQGVEPCSFVSQSHSTLFAPMTEIVNPGSFAGIAPTPGNLGYWLVTLGGEQSHFGDAPDLGQVQSDFPVVGVADASAGGYWWAASDGGVFALGTAPFFGSLGGLSLNAPIVGIAPTPDHGGYWLVGADGGVFAFGDAVFHGSIPGVLKPGQSLNQPVVGVASSPDGKGYWLVARDGGVFAFGDAQFHGSMGGTHLNKPVVGMAGNTMGGYWLVASDGGLFAFDAAFKGSLGNVALNAPVTGMASTNDGLGYWMVGSDGGVFAFGNAPFWGSAA